MLGRVSQSGVAAALCPRTPQRGPSTSDRGRVHGAETPPRGGSEYGVRRQSASDGPPSPCRLRRGTRRFGFLVRGRARVESTSAGSRLCSDQRTVTDAWTGKPKRGRRCALPPHSTTGPSISDRKRFMGAWRVGIRRAWLGAVPPRLGGPPRPARDAVAAPEDPVC